MGLILGMKIKFNIEGEVDGKMATAIIAMADSLLRGLTTKSHEVVEHIEEVAEVETTEIQEEKTRSCKNCGTTETKIWRKTTMPDGPLCNACYAKEYNESKRRAKDAVVEGENVISCKKCGTSETPQWRNRHEDFGPLCNKCGVAKYKATKRLESSGLAKSKRNIACPHCSRTFAKSHHLDSHLRYCSKNSDNTASSTDNSARGRNRRKRGEPPNPFKRIVVPSKEELAKKLAKKKPTYYDIPNESDLRHAVHNYICGNLGQITKSDTMARGLVAIAKSNDLKFRTMIDNVIRDLSNRIGQLMRELAEKLPADSSMLTTTNDGVNIVVLNTNLSVDNLNELFV